MKSILIVLLVLVFVFGIIYISASSFFNVNWNKIINAFYQNSTSSRSLPSAIPAPISGLPAGNNSQPSTEQTSSIDFHGPTSPPHIIGPSGPPPTSSSF